MQKFIYLPYNLFHQVEECQNLATVKVRITYRFLLPTRPITQPGKKIRLI